MSFYYRSDKESEYGPYRHEWDEPDGVMHSEAYSYKPVPSGKMAGMSHHCECPYNGTSIGDCMCFELFNKKAEDDREKEEYEQWQYYNGIGD